MLSHSLTKPLLLSLVLPVAAVSLAGCGGMGKALGFGKNPPDEFAVVTKAPLVLPPDYTLRPPKPGAPRPQERPTSEIAARSVFSPSGQQGESTADAPSVGERELLAKAGAMEVDPDIRRQIDAESRIITEKSRSFVNSLLFWQKPEETAKVVDAEVEAARIRQNQSQGKPLTVGETPTVETESLEEIEE